jgi:hypothetical protein
VVRSECGDNVSNFNVLQRWVTKLRASRAQRAAFRPVDGAKFAATARIFSEIRETLNVDTVNLVWRHLATMPGALKWVWASLKPLYQGPAIAAPSRKPYAADA